ncbi:MAG: NAD-dependent epimerase/dehydratase family protein, partial [Bacteroidales bacterium]|nr:NAD-dependent epimerase/dehydratase family protein [Bacteroidales bacterium]
DRASNECIEAVYEYDLDSTPEQLDEWCAKADFVFNLAGVNRPQNASEFMEGNFGFASTLLDTLRKHGNTCPVMLSSSQQASLTGRFGNSEYGRSKKAGEDLFLAYGKEIAGLAGNDGRAPGLRPRVLVYRFPNLFGKWCRPNYNSAVATFCNAIANDLPYTVNDPSVELELLYIDDLVDEMIACLRGEEHRCEFDGLEVIPVETPDQFGGDVMPVETPDQFGGDVMPDSDRASQGRYCYVPVTHKATLGEIVELLKSFAAQPQTLLIPEIPAGSFAKKLYSTYLSYLPKEKVAFPLKMNVDDRGSFTELVHTLYCGQVSINISKPGITKGQHWHNTKWEFFIVVAGHGLIQERRLGSDEVIEFEVSGDNIQCVHMLPGYTHNIINLSDTENLVTVMYCNEIFDPNKPDTYFEPVK